MTKAELDRLKYETISFKDIITGGWALKFQACLVNKYNSYLFLLVDRASPSGARTSGICGRNLGAVGAEDS